MHSDSAARSLLEKMERARLARRFTQHAVAEQLGITQPHYSKIVRGTAALTNGMHDAIDAWLNQYPPPPVQRADELMRLTRRIERDVAKLNRLLAQEGRRPQRRALASEEGP
ncbi:MAG TPA: XRE family transcriptional regulator [Erythrobacter sp.]|jgi:transcriptional regulator with XRE-family HTH domain|uniref:helix-turn-helix domain-containing protein n=1 Tax=Sphingomonadales TaxID=204457 RepID=UPI0009EE73C5|nr:MULTISPECIES: helix-turn-helix domain-containing protein [Erythrobacteraceae]ASP29482.1 hypothetical protein CHH26_03930 [Qipengyuania flava]PNQ77548.1 XRE family transcriptional regulator [Erythrobacter sp. SAORIC-644]HAW37352.1 XRE family transcriptional regulator [Erythrobacter sp.]|tara:strand:+ start:944 stop:1279 length:336 start_codon:yes stop_codon:yes gene_type:complete